MPRNEACKIFKAIRSMATHPPKYTVHANTAIRNPSNKSSEAFLKSTLIDYSKPDVGARLPRASFPYLVSPNLPTERPYQLLLSVKVAAMAHASRLQKRSILIVKACDAPDEWVLPNSAAIGISDCGRLNISDFIKDKVFFGLGLQLQSVVGAFNCIREPDCVVVDMKKGRACMDFVVTVEDHKTELNLSDGRYSSWMWVRWEAVERLETSDEIKKTLMDVFASVEECADDAAHAQCREELIEEVQLRVKSIAEKVTAQDAAEELERVQMIEQNHLRIEKIMEKVHGPLEEKEWVALIFGLDAVL